jgi:hypothetical protein
MQVTELYQVRVAYSMRVSGLDARSTGAHL